MKKYTTSHEWIEIQEGVGLVGVSDYAQNELGDIVYIELPEVGAEVKAGQEAVVLESTKAAADVYAPVSGEIIEVNTKLQDAPELINSDAEEKGWLFKVQLNDESELEKLMEKEAYLKQFQGQS